MKGAGGPAFSPGVSLVLPTASGRGGLVSPGWQVNLPFSEQMNDVYWHWNAGLTWLPRVDVGRAEKVSLESPFLGGSGIYRIHPMFHAMLEALVLFDESFTGERTERERLFTASPGVRGGWDIGDGQLILGLAVPVTWGGGERDTAAFVYTSYELPFRRP